MSIQNDILSGVDLQAINQPTKAQLQQAINGAVPMPNIAFVIVQETAPDVTNNPRFARYPWMDISTEPPTFKRYNATTPAWEVLPISTAAVVEDSIADGAVIYDTKIGGFVVGDALKLLRVNAAGDGLELLAFTSANLPTIGLDKLTLAGGGTHYLLKFNAAGTALGYEAFSSDLIGANILPLTKLVNGSVGQYGYILRANPATGTIELVDNTDEGSNIFKQKSIRVDRLSVTGAATKYTLRYNTAGGVWAAEKSVHISADTAVAATSKLITAEAHGLGGTPDTVKLYAVCKLGTYNATHKYAIGDIFELSTLFSASLNTCPFYYRLLSGGTQYDVGCVSAAGASVHFCKADASDECSLTITQFATDFNVRAVLTRLAN